MQIEGEFLRGSIQVQGRIGAEDRRKLDGLTRIHEESGAITAYKIIDGQWWRLLTAGFVHIGFLHLLMNMACLYFAGRFIEQMWGHVRYLVIYLVALLGGSCLGVVHHTGLSAGASGAVCGILAAEAVWFLFNRRYLPRALLRQARTNFIVNLVLLVFISSFQNVSGWGHFGGAAAGALAALLMHLQRFGPPVWRWLALAGFVPMAWYGHYAIEQARATDEKWQQVEEEHFRDRYRQRIQEAGDKAADVYDEDVAPVLEMHPTRRDAAKVEALRNIVVEQQRELSALAERLANAGPYHNPETEAQRQAGHDYVAAMAELFAQVEHMLRIGEERTDKDKQGLQSQGRQVLQLREDWEKLLQK
jgi:membrane associated rhomboid family serine protease